MTLEDTLFHPSPIQDLAPANSLYTSNHSNSKLMWAQDWLRRFRSGKIVSVELSGRNDAAIANRQSTLASLENAGCNILVLDDEETGFVIVHTDGCKQPSDYRNASHIEATSIEAYFQSDEQQPTEDCEEAFISAASAYSMDLCGRGDYNHIFQDLRSASQAVQRDKSTRQKYYNFKYVKRGEIGALNCESGALLDNDRETSTVGDQSTITKSELYRQAQLPPRPPKYHRRHIDKIRGTICLRVDARREARKHGKAIMEGHLRDL